MRRIGSLLGSLLFCIIVARFAFAQSIEPTTTTAPATTTATTTTSPTTQTTEPASNPTTTQAANPATLPVLPAIALAEIYDQMEAGNVAIRTIEGDLTPEALNPPYADQLTSLGQQLDAQEEEARLTLNAQPTNDSLRTLAGTWQALAGPLADWKKDLTNRVGRLDKDVATLADLTGKWNDRLKQAQTSASPDDLVYRISGLLGKLQHSRSSTEKGRSQILNLQNTVQTQYNRVTQMLATIKTAQEQLVGRLLVKDSDPVWVTVVHGESPQSVIALSQTSLSNQMLALKTFAKREYPIFIAHAFIGLLLIALLYWVRGRVDAWVTAEPDLKSAFDVFYFPISTGLLLTVVASIWIYTQAPHLLWVILGTAMITPSIYLLRQVLDRRYYPVLNGMAVFYAFDQIRNLLSSQAVLSRVLFLIEMLAGVLFVLWLIRGGQISAMAKALHGHFSAGLTFLLRIDGVLFLSALGANAVGYVGLGKLIGGGALIAGYLAMIFYTAAEIIDGLIMASLRLYPLSLLNLVKHQRDVVYDRVSKFMRFAVVALWFWFILDLFAIRGPVVATSQQIATATLAVGPLKLSLWNLFSFAFVIWASFALSRFARFLLNEDIYPRLDLPRGLPYAFSTALHYVVLLIGFFTAVGTLGYDLSQFTILAGAFGVGLGFGLQNIVNNFVSGIILLFERPLKIGDTIEIDGLTGVVRVIGIRASVIRTTLGSELVVPNSRFISEKVTNWTFSTGQRAIQLSLNVAPDSDPQKVIDLLVATARAHELITDDPSPQALLSGFSAGSMTFDLQAWTKRYEDWTAARSQLAIKIVEAIKTAGIVLK